MKSNDQMNYHGIHILNSFWITAQLKYLISYKILSYLCKRVQESPEPWTKQSLGEAGRTTETVNGRSK